LLGERRTKDELEKEKDQRTGRGGVGYHVAGQMIC